MMMMMIIISSSIVIMVMMMTMIWKKQTAWAPSGCFTVVFYVPFLKVVLLRYVHTL